MLKKDYYLILGVSRNESVSGIRAAFRALAKRYHPERVGPRGARFFQDILAAYQVLADPEKRRHYDQGLFHAEGKTGERNEPLAMGPGTQRAPAVPEPLPILTHFETIAPLIEDVLGRAFRNFSRTDTSVEEPLRSYNMQIVLSPEDALRGGLASIHVPVCYPCSSCGGSGRDGFFTCTACEGQGMVEEEETVRVHIPPLVRDYTLMEVPLRGLGVHHSYLRLYIRVLR